MSRIALVTGGVTGLGVSIATMLAAEGYTVAVTCPSESDAADHRLQLGLPVYGWDVADYDACTAGLSRVEADLGPVDVLVNNAGVIADAMLHKMAPQQWTTVLRTNLDSMFNVCRPVIGGMRDRGFGRIINITSVNGQKGQLGQTNYSAAKAGIIGFTKALALESASKGITVNAVAPGYCATQMVADVPENVMNSILASLPVGRLGRPEEIARCVTFLASEDAGFITGATLNANGGLYMM